MKKIPPRISMRFFLITMFCSFGIMSAAAGYSQQREFDVSFSNATIESALDELRTITGHQFLYEGNIMAGSGRVNFSLEDATLRHILDRLLTANGYAYRVESNLVTITRQQPQRREAYVTGTVANEQGEPMVGVSVRLDGSTRGTITDANGRFLMSNVVLPARLIFSFLGYETMEVEVGVDSDLGLSIVMVETAIVGEEVIVTGYQTIRKPNMVGSAVNIKMDDLDYDGVNSLESMLQGKVAGMVIQNTSGLVGSRQRVRVRGTSTLLGNQEPVWVVDGIIQEDPLPFKAQELDSFDPESFDMMRNFVGSAIAWLNPNDIEDITILKDAAATVMYGVKAANGVIVITTKKGQEGRMAISYSGGVSVTERLNYNRMNLMNSKERIAVSREMYDRRLYGDRQTEMVGYEQALSRYLNKEIDYATFDARVKYLEGVNTDWFDILFQTPLSHNHSIGFSGGTERVTYYASAGARQVLGTARGNNSDLFSGNINVSARITDRLHVSAGLSASTGKTTGFYTVDPYTYAHDTSRAIPFADENGEPVFYNKDNSPYMFNVQHELDNTGNENTTRSLNFNFNARYKFLDNLEFNTTFGFSQNSNSAKSWATERSFYITKIRQYEYGMYGPEDEKYGQSMLRHGGELSTADARSQSWTWRNQLSFNQVWNGVHRFNAMAGMEMRSARNDGYNTRVYGYFPERGHNISMPSMTIIPTAATGDEVPNPIYDRMAHTVSGSLSNFLAAYASATYSFDERYVASASIRSDASNRFGQNKRNRFLPVWSLGARWNVHNEPWMRDQKTVSELNLRLSYGWQGNVLETVSPDLILTIPDELVNPTTGEMQLAIRNLPYADLRWEKVSTYNIGVDVGLFRNRFMFSAEYYLKRTKDMVNNEPLPQAYGIPSMPVNAGEMLNEGVDLSLSGTIVRRKDFTWTMALNTAKNFNRVDSDIDLSSNWMVGTAGRLNKRGYPVSAFWAFDFTGIDPETGYPMFDIPTAQENPAAVRDVTAYMRYMGKGEPDFSGGLSTSVRYKRLSLSTSFNLNLGGKRFLYRMFQSNSLPSAYNNLPKEFVGRWTPQNRDSNIPGIPGEMLLPPTYTTLGVPQVMLPNEQEGYLYEMYNYSSARVVNASFLRCTSISLSYTLPERMVRAMKLRNVSVGAAVSSPFMIVSKEYKGMDPEVATGNQPVSRTFSLNVNISF